MNYLEFTEVDIKSEFYDWNETKDLSERLQRQQLLFKFLEVIENNKDYNLKFEVEDDDYKFKTTLYVTTDYSFEGLKNYDV